jgi:hypothetical protein
LLHVAPALGAAALAGIGKSKKESAVNTAMILRMGLVFT